MGIWIGCIYKIKELKLIDQYCPLKNQQAHPLQKKHQVQLDYSKFHNPQYIFGAE